MKFFCLNRMTLLAQIVVSGTLAVAFLGAIAALFVFAWFQVDVPAGTKEILCTLIGILAREFGDMCGHWLFDKKVDNDATGSA